MTSLLFKRFTQYHLHVTSKLCIYQPRKLFASSTSVKNVETNWRTLVENSKQQPQSTSSVTVAPSKVYSIRRTWSNQDTERLLQLVKKYGNKWKVFTSYFPGRTAFCIRSHYLSVTNDTTRWTLEEKKTLQQNLGEEADPEKIDWEAIRTCLPKRRTIARIKQFWQNSIQPTLNRGSWTKEENERLKDLVSKHGTDWELISQKMNTRSEDQCRNKWAYEITTMKKGMHSETFIDLSVTLLKGEFSKEEDEALIGAVRKYGLDEFQKIKQEMNSKRSLSQLRTRYYNFLDPDLDKSPWTREEKALAIELFQELKNIKAVKAKMNSKRSIRDMYNQLRNK